MSTVICSVFCVEVRYSLSAVGVSRPCLWQVNPVALFGRMQTVLALQTSCRPAYGEGVQIER